MCVGGISGTAVAEQAEWVQRETKLEQCETFELNDPIVPAAAGTGPSGRA